MRIFSRKLLIPVKQCLSFAKDNFFKSARDSLEEAGIKLTQLFGTEIEIAGIGKLILPVMDSVFFHPDRFEVVIDARGYRPEDIKCSISPRLVEVIAQKQENFESANRAMSFTRSFQLPQNVKPEEGNCCLSSEGLLLITAPWLK